MEKHTFNIVTKHMRLKRQKSKLQSLIFKATDPIVLQNCIELLERSKVGVQKYGTTLSENKLPKEEWIQHAKEEAMDFINYLERLKSEFPQDSQKKRLTQYDMEA